MVTRVQAFVSEVQDGDTFTTADKEVVRLAEVCAPEVGKPGSAQATQTLRGLVERKYVTLERVARDSYARTVADVWVDGTHVNAYMRRAGYNC